MPSTQMAKLNEKLAANPDFWMVSEEANTSAPIINEEHMAEIAAKIKVHARQGTQHDARLRCGCAPHARLRVCDALLAGRVRGKYLGVGAAPCCTAQHWQSAPQR